MKLNYLKGLVLATTALVGVSIATSSVKAADNVAVGVGVDSIVALEVAKLNDMTFGKWLFDVEVGSSSTLVLNPTTNAVVSAPGGASTFSQIANTSRSGRVSVDIPAGMNNYALKMQRGAITDFTDTGLSLTEVTYITAIEATPAILVEAVDANVTVVSGGTPEAVSFGGTLTVTEQPADGPATPAEFTVTFAY